MSFRRGLILTTNIRRVPSRAFWNLPTAPPLPAVSPKPPSPVPRLAENIARAKDVRTIHKEYPRFIAACREFERTVPPLDVGQFTDVLCLLARSARTSDLSRMKSIVEDMHTNFSLHLDSKAHTEIIRSFAQAGHIGAVQNWLIRMPTLPNTLSPTLSQYNVALQCLSSTGVPLRALREIVHSMQATGTKPDVTIFVTLVKSRWDPTAIERDGIPDIAVFKSIIRDMAKAGLYYDPEIASAMVEGFEAAGDHSAARQVQDMYTSQCPVDPRISEMLRWETLITDAAHAHGLSGAKSVFQSLAKEGCWPGPKVVQALLRYSRDVDELRAVEAEYGVKAHSAVWFRILDNCLVANDPGKAESVYQAAKAADIPITPKFVNRYASFLCRPKTALAKKQPSTSDVLSAVRLWRDCLGDGPATDRLEDSEASYEVLLHRTLLRGISSCPEPEKFMKFVPYLRKYMEATQVPSDPNTTANLIVWLIRTADMIDDAFERYEELRSGLDGNGYEIVLAAFCQRPYKSGLPPTNLYMSIAKHMRDAGHPFTIKVYTMYLQQISYAAEFMYSSERERQLHESVRQIYGYLKLDPHIVPDAIFYNQLMDTYHRLGSFNLCLEVWDTMYSTGRYNNASISVFFDACGFARSLQPLMNVRNRMIAEGFPLNINNWKSYVEALCRCRRLNDAAKFVCVDMGSGGFPAPTVEFAKLLIFFSQTAETANGVLTAVHRHHPHLLNDPEILVFRTPRFDDSALEELERTRASLIGKSRSTDSNKDRTS